MSHRPQAAIPWDLILIRVLHRALFPQDRTCDLRERCTAGDRCEPLGSGGMWTNVDRLVGWASDDASAANALG